MKSRRSNPVYNHETEITNSFPPFYSNGDFGMKANNLCDGITPIAYLSFSQKEVTLISICEVH